MSLSHSPTILIVHTSVNCPRYFALKNALSDKAGVQSLTHTKEIDATLFETLARKKSCLGYYRFTTLSSLFSLWLYFLVCTHVSVIENESVISIQ